VRYDPTNFRHLNQLREDAALEGDDCPVDDICDSIPAILNYLQSLEGRVRESKSTIQKLEADNRDLERRLNNTKSQKFRLAKKKGKTLHN
jgi:septal ring factor EnvC (AmiA/AmiB activator)